MRDYVGVSPETLPDVGQHDFQPRLRDMLNRIDYYLLDQSKGLARISIGQNPDGSGEPLGGDNDGGVFFRLQGRSPAQIAHFGTGDGASGILASTTSGAKGKIFLGNAQLSAYDEANNRFGVGTASPSATLHASGATSNDLTLRPSGTRVVVGAEWEWRGQDGGSNLEAYVDEVTADDNDYIKIRVGNSDFQAQNSAVLLLPTPSSTPSASNTHTLRIRYRRTGSGGIGAPTGPGLDAAVYKNGILVAGGSFISIAEAAISGSFTEATAVLNATQITNLGNYQGLEIWLNWTGSTTGVAAGSEMQVSFVELDCGTASSVVDIARFDDGGIGVLPTWTWNTGMTAVTPDSSGDNENTTARIHVKTLDTIDIFKVLSNGATTINVPFTTYSASNPIALTLEMDDPVSPNNPMFRVRTFSSPDSALSNVFTVGYNGQTRIDMSSNAIAFSIQQTASATADFIFLESSAGVGLLGVDSNGDIYGGNQATSTLNFFSDNNADSTTGSIRMTATPTVEIRSGASGNTHVPYTFGIGTAGNNQFTGNNVKVVLNSTSGGATAGSPSMTVDNSDATNASIATVLYKAIRKSGQTGHLFDFLDSNGSTVLSYVAADGTFTGPLTGSGLSTFDHVLIDNATASDVLLYLSPHPSQTANLITVRDFSNTYNAFSIDAGSLVTISETTATDDTVRFQVRCPSTQTQNILQVVRAFGGGNYTAWSMGSTGTNVFGDTGLNGPAVIRLQLNQGNGQSVNIMEVKNTAATASCFTIDQNMQLSLADYLTTTKSLKFKLTDSTASSELALDYRSNGNRGLIWDLSGAATGTVTAVALVTAGTGYTTGAGKATTGGSGTGCTINISTVGGGGAITAVASAPTAAGTGYKVGDILTITTGGTGGTVRVVSLGGSLTLAWAGTTTSRTVTFPSTVSFTVAGLQVPSQTFTRTQTITPTTGTECLVLNCDSSSGVADVDTLSLVDTVFGQFGKWGAGQGLQTGGNVSFYPSGTVGSGFSGQLAAATLSASRIWTFPNFAGTVLVNGATNTNTGQTAALAVSDLIPTPGVATTWMICATVSCTTAGALAQVTVNVHWRDAADSVTNQIFPLASKNLDSTGAGQGVMYLKTHPSTAAAIRFSISYTGSGAQVYSYTITATKT